MDRDFSVPILVTVIGIDLFVMDLMVPSGRMGGMWYVTVVLATWWLPTGSMVLCAATVASFLAISGFSLSHPGHGLWWALTDRSAGLLLIWIAAAFLWYVRDARTAVYSASKATNPHPTELSTLP